jgi:hypothetical protein
VGAREFIVLGQGDTRHLSTECMDVENRYQTTPPAGDSSEAGP